MRGKLEQWNDEKGFGFIKTGQNSEKIFVHISALKRAGRRPVIGDSISFDIFTDNKGKKRATNCYIQGVRRTEAENSYRNYRNNNQKKNSLIGTASLALFLFIGYGLYQNVFKENFYAETNLQQLTAAPDKRQAYKASYFCQAGKEYCSQMHSCEEARYYITHCPNTKMDGDGDGIPCEKQWCQ